MFSYGRLCQWLSVPCSGWDREGERGRERERGNCGECTCWASLLLLLSYQCYPAGQINKTQRRTVPELVYEDGTARGRKSKIYQIVRIELIITMIRYTTIFVSSSKRHLLQANCFQKSHALASNFKVSSQRSSLPFATLMLQQTYLGTYATLD